MQNSSSLFWLYFGHHLDQLISSTIPNCSKNVTILAINLLENRKSDCTRSQTCLKTRYTLDFTIQKLYGTLNDTRIYVAFENPEVEYRNTYISYDLFSLIAEVGGTLGLTLGTSILTLLDTVLKRLPYY